MNTYFVDLAPEKVSILSKNGDLLSSIFTPKLEKEIYYPILYIVKSADGSKIGEIKTYLPKDRHTKLVLKGMVSDIFRNNGQTLLRLSESEAYDIKSVGLNQLKEKEQLEKMGFYHGYVIERNGTVGTFYIFRKNGQERALLKLDGLEYSSFIPLILQDRIEEHLKGKKIKEIPSVPLHVPVSEDTTRDTERKSLTSKTGLLQTPVIHGSYVEFVKKFPVIRQESAVRYLDQKGEWEIFSELMDKGRPVMLNGPTGQGKSTMVKYYAYLNKLPVYKLTGHKDTNIRDIEGYWIPTQDKPIKSPGPLILSMVHGGIFFFEEIGPVKQEVMYGLHTFLDDREFTLQSHFGFERINAEPNCKIVFGGNLQTSYTQNKFNASFLRRFGHIKRGYPPKNLSIEILKMRSPGLDDKTASMIIDVLFDIRQTLKDNEKEIDVGLAEPVEVAQAYMRHSNLSLKTLMEIWIVGHCVTYEEDDKLEKELMKTVNKHVK